MYQKFLTMTMFAVCTYTDVRYRKVYAWSLFLYGILAAGGHLFSGRTTAADVAAGLLPGLLCMVVSWVSRQALGYGDSFLIVLCGVSLGIAGCLRLLMTVCFLTGIAGLVLLTVCRKSRSYAIPFVPFLFLGMLLTGNG